MNDFHGPDGPHGTPAADGAPGQTPPGQAPAEGYPQQPADGHGQPYGHSYGYAPPAPGGWGDGAPGYPDGAPGPEAYGPGPGQDAHPQAGYDPSGYDQGGYARPGYGTGYEQAGYEQTGHGHGGYAENGYTQGGYAQPDYVQPGDPRAGGGPGAYAAPGDPYGAAGPGHSHAPDDGTTYVPEPIGVQLPSDAEPGNGFGGSAAGGTWSGQAAAGQAQAAPPAADTWAAAPAPAPAWGTTPGGAPGYAPGQDADYGSGYGRQPAPAPRHAPDVPAAVAAPAGYAPAGDEQEPELERTAALPVVEQEAAVPPHRTGSPIIPPGIQPAGLTAVLGLLLAGGAAVGKPALAVVLVLLQAVTAAGWFRLNGMWPARQGIVLAFLSGVTVDIAVLAVSGGHGPVALLGTLGVWLLLVLVLQLRHHGSADERLSSLTATSASTLLTVVAGGYLLTATSHAGSDPVVVGAVAVAAATLVRAVRLPGGEPVSLAAALVVAAATGVLTGPATGFGSGHSVLLAAAAGACALIGLRVASYDWPSRFVHFTAGVALPLTAAAPVVYALGAALT
ncbi:hypothetical protein [Streptomyces sp. NBC_00448]|uniref:hypothetical protein n=1 Tax=Streptomyces sp. NBC_00448 TaxID=2903652 RepID=UPI002E2294AA